MYISFLRYASSFSLLYMYIGTCNVPKTGRVYKNIACIWRLGQYVEYCITCMMIKYKACLFVYILIEREWIWNVKKTTNPPG